MIINSSATSNPKSSYNYYYTSSCFILVSIFIEIIFYLIYKFHLKRKANDIRYKTIKPYRDYGEKRHLLFKRILDRIEGNCKLENKDMDIELHTFLRNWFHPSPDQSSVKLCQEERLNSVTYPSLDKRGTSISSSSSESDMDGINYDNNSHVNSSTFCKEDLLEFFTWAFFDKRYVELDKDWEKEELSKIFEILSSRYGFVYQSYKDKDSNHVRLKPKCMTLEDCKPLHRPLALYGLFFIIRMVGYLVLYFKGFRRYTIETPIEVGGHCKKKMLSYWLLDTPRNDKSHPLSPILFFHGIAPAGLSFYIPMLFKSMVRDGDKNNRPIFLFENLPITCSLVFHALTEEETIFCVEEALQRHGFIGTQRNNMILVGHSFGSFQSTWLLKSPLLSKDVQKVILIDPVSILLSEPDVVTNFLYNRTADAFNNYCCIKGEDGGICCSFVELLNRLKIRLLASSELGIEWYLRRNFAWYNSELWIEDIPTCTEISVFVSELDEIIDSKKVMNETRKFPNVKLNSWKDVGHAAVLTRSHLWNDVSKEFEETVNLNGGSKITYSSTENKKCKGKME
jgi:pimeloyl-ACP methyl ester carboxylesterase